MNQIQNGTTNTITATSAGVVFDIIPGGMLWSEAPIIYNAVTYPTAPNTSAVVSVGVSGVVESARNAPDVGFGKGLYLGMVAAFACAVVIMFLRGAKSFFRGHVGSSGD